MRKPDMSGQWLLDFAVRRWVDYGIGFASVTQMPVEAKTLGVGVQTVRGLKRRGWIVETARGIYYITEEGMNANEFLRRRCNYCNKKIAWPSRKHKCAFNKEIK